MQTLTESKLENITLYYRKDGSDKVYQCGIEAAGERFVVNYAHGRRGSTLTTGTKTNVPVDYDSARRLFDQLVKEKKNHPRTPYTEGEDGTPYQQPADAERFSGILPQLLNPIDEAEVERLLHDDDYCAQEKHNGRHILIRKQESQIDGINKKGLLVGLPVSVLDDIRNLPGTFTPDGESVGDYYHAFDLLVLNGKDLRPLPYRKRLASLMNLLASAQHRFIKYTETAFTTKQKIALLKRLKTENREGIVFKRLDAPYTPDRPNSGGPQLKHKFCATASCVVAKLNVRRSVEIRLLNREGWIPCGNVTIPANHKIPAVGQVIEVRYLYAHKESNALYQPVYLGPRDDVDVSECVLRQLKYKPEDET
jgi:bifunctional non-homologous end joining protein LigD